MKKIVIASAAMGGAALIAFGASGTFAAFSDSDTVSNSAGAGTLVLDAGGDNSATLASEDIGLQPGESTQFAYWIDNGGTLDGTLTMVGDVTDAADTCNSGSETTADDCELKGAGDFSATALLTAGYAAATTTEASCVDDVDFTPAAEATGIRLSQAEGTGLFPRTLAAGKGACLVVSIGLDSGVGNTVQGDSASLSIDLTLAQVI